MVFKATRLEETTKRVSVDRKEKRAVEVGVVMITKSSDSLIQPIFNVRNHSNARNSVKKENKTPAIIKDMILWRGR